MTIPAKGQGIIGTGIAIGLPPNTYGHIAPRSGLALKHSLAVNAGVIDADYTGEIKVILVKLGTKEYKIHKEDKIAQLIVERIASEEAILGENLENTERGIKGFGSSDRELTNQVGTNLLTKSSTQEKSSLREITQGAPHRTPRPRKTPLQVRTGADLLINQSQKVTERSGKEGSHNQHPKMAEEPLSELSQEASQKMPRTNTIPLQAGTGPDLLTKQPWENIGPPEQHKKNNKPQGKIYISEITQKEFRKAYRNGETTGVVKFSQKEKQIYLRRINISTELAIRDQEEQKTKTRIMEDSLEKLVPKEYHDLLPAFEKGEKTSLPPHRPGIDLEINMEEGKGLPDQKIYPLGAEELETVQEYIRKNEARG